MLAGGESFSAPPAHPHSLHAELEGVGVAGREAAVPPAPWAFPALVPAVPCWGPCTCSAPSVCSSTPKETLVSMRIRKITGPFFPSAVNHIEKCYSGLVGDTPLGSPPADFSARLPAAWGRILGSIPHRQKAPFSFQSR